MGPWVGYWSLQPRLHTLTESKFTAYGHQFPHGGAYLLLRRQWLLELGHRRDWPDFSTVYRNGPVPRNLSIRCYAAMDPLLGPASASPAQLWLAASPGNAACNAMARHALAGGTLGTDILWKRLPALFASGDSRAAWRFSGYLPPHLAEASRAILRDPALWLAQEKRQEPPGWDIHDRNQLLELALLHGARRNPSLAVTQARSLAALTPEARARVIYHAAHLAAGNLKPQAATWFGLALRADPEFRPDTRTLAWMVRSSLLSRNWIQVQQAIRRMPERKKTLGEWQFWKAFALYQMGDRLQARNIFAGLSSPWTYYGQLSLAALNRRLVLPESTAAPPQAHVSVLQDTLEQNLSLQQAIELYRLGLYFDALWEWGKFLAGVPSPGGIHAAADIAIRHQAWLLAINASTRVSGDLDWRQGFLLPYLGDIRNAARRNGLPTAFVAGLIRQESGFSPGIRSSAGARGIMQVMPATAAWIRNRFPSTDTEDMDSTRGNIAIGSAYLSYVQTQFRGSLLLAAAAYNAGPGAPRSWLQKWKFPPSPWDGAIFTANIPYRQTRNYVEAVLSNTAVYQALLQHTHPAPLSFWRLGPFQNSSAG